MLGLCRHHVVQFGSSLGDPWRAPAFGGGGSLAVDLTRNIAFAPELLLLQVARRSRPPT